MASMLLIEGLLDAKGPRGSDDRKFWKAWSRQWARFSVVYPSGRREPYLVITLSHKSSEAPSKEIKLSRDGLRLFRCRSKSRSFRAWAITSGNKVVLYFAAETEVQAQNWMQAVRDGLWPPCFSFQMLTACSYEVSLVDDDNTFMAGHLGVYGRFVMTSEDVISLMHPHWGSTLLEISLDNIIDVLFIKEAEIAPAGVFSIILKRIEGSNVKNLQFYCNTANDAMQWILSKLHTRRKSFSLNGNRKRNENRVSFSVLDDSVSSKTNLHKNKGYQKTISSIDNQLITSQTDNQLVNITNTLTATNLQSENENTELLQMSSSQNENKYSSLEQLKSNDVRCSSQKPTVEQFKNCHFQPSSSDSKKTIKNCQSDFKSRENIYENTTATRLETFFTTTKEFDSSKNECPNQNKINEESDLTTNDLLLTQIRDDFKEYAVIDKSQFKSEELNVTQFLSNERHIYSNYVLGSDNFIKPQILNSSKELRETIAESSLGSNYTDNAIDQSEKELSKKFTLLNYDSNFSEFIKSNDNLYSTAHKSASKNLSMQTESIHCPVDVSYNDFRNSTEKNYLLANFPSNFLDTSINSLNPRNGSKGSSSSCEEDNENLLSLVNEFDELNVNELYEDISERKDTLYEEIDDTEDEFVNPTLSAPELPNRPTNLKIPESLKLQRLSRNIQHTLDLMDDKQTQKEISSSNFIKKIKDVNRIMQLSSK